MVLDRFRSAIEKILGDGEVKTTKKSDFRVSDDEVGAVYSAVEDAVGKDNLMLVGGCALSHYIKHDSGDIDILIRYGGNIMDAKEGLQKRGFDGFERVHHPSLNNSTVYKTVYVSGSGRRVPVDIYVNRLSGCLSSVDSRRKARVGGMDVNIASLPYVGYQAYHSWKNRLFNGRGDKDYNYMLELGRSFVGSFDFSPYLRKMGRNRASRIKSVAGIYIAGLMRDAIRKHS